VLIAVGQHSAEQETVGGHFRKQPITVRLLVGRKLHCNGARCITFAKSNRLLRQGGMIDRDPDLKGTRIFPYDLRRRTMVGERITLGARIHLVSLFFR